MINLVLLFQFAKFGALCFGGGYMIIPMLMTAYVEKNPVFTMDEFGNLLSVSQITPGAVSVNTATYVGFLQNGFWGAIFASVGLVLPTLLLATIAIHFMKKWKDTWIIQGILTGARMAALSMVIFAVFIFMGMSIFSAPIPWNEVGHFFISGVFNKPPEFYFNLVELFICILSAIIVYYTKMPITLLLFCAGLLGALLPLII